ncbi:MAG: hypothetical protein ACOC1X_01915 [Promethearchaeota archaeon]
MVKIEFIKKSSCQKDFEKNKCAADSMINFNSTNRKLIQKYLDWVEEKEYMEPVFAKIYINENVSVVGINMNYFNSNIQEKNSQKEFNNSLYSKFNFIRNKKEVQKLQEK